MYEFYGDCPFRQMNDEAFMPGYIPMPVAAQPMFQQEIPDITAGMPAEAPGGTTAVPPFPTPQTLKGMDSASFEMAPGSPVQQDINYTQGYLRTQIGKRMLVSFLIGTNTYQDRTGVLEKVGISYIILKEQEGTQLLCDIYSIKFVRIFSDRE
ncbi:hypothetical protein M2651_04390 [Clostridium sp. SYSU_GA19001]|uniref:hypothetical protein n=1 Tax=Clostridium caldaquaticum TaxID=2940653 RepID=UPI002076D60C|nr:hypothetical protein [Clostridium caldaquaticum]MCM8710264.1 hypothetical protein [Clostridium caldaquaticum]